MQARVVQSVRLLMVSVLSLFTLVEEARAQNEPLPKGAKVRAGVTRQILRTSPGVGLVAPAFDDFLAPTLTGGVRRFVLATGLPLEEGIIGPGKVVVSANGKRAAVARLGAVTVLDVAKPKEIQPIVPPIGVVFAGTPGISLSADGSVLAFGGQGRNKAGVVVIWDLVQNQEISRVQTAQSAPIFPTLSHDGKTLVTHGPPLLPPVISSKPVKPMPKPLPKPDEDGDTARTAQVWDVANGNELFKAPSPAWEAPWCQRHSHPTANWSHFPPAMGRSICGK